MHFLCQWIPIVCVHVKNRRHVFIKRFDLNKKFKEMLEMLTVNENRVYIIFMFDKYIESDLHVRRQQEPRVLLMSLWRHLNPLLVHPLLWFPLPSLLAHL